MGANIEKHKGPFVHSWHEYKKEGKDIRERVVNDVVSFSFDMLILMTLKHIVSFNVNPSK